ncbi:ATP-binding protein [Streptomyces acidiscabies]|uniref:ATP-binding protein n=1 Tax=Streptomyces acidiscabies TaxID=42234 RepID=A0AAP6BJE7_9ACTN|nr:ATP-binding protein [Streptomyces acidiscabies]MBP5938666.1 ATP-binding protein [Streptomyces sp. LBUM 1476]MBZ3909769.1 ATP-binding protein [Streptomyces acidiscabies]MDX2965798.1 ATP-binding protein [Streptomyces acidiscabies]MDX3025240.1 ATP-binding protein [Streptomyces acidiscabies]MDX3795634.1 ATP-binding protein [Streptomyces acidiscabies]
MEHPDRFVVSCSREPERVSQIRRTGAAHLSKWGLNSLVDTASLLISELVTNAVRYGTGDITFSMAHRSGEVLIEVTDGSSAFPRVRHPTADEESGRGMFLVEAMADRWGTSADGTHTWCTIAVRQPLTPIAGFRSEWRQGNRLIASGSYSTPQDTIRYARAQLRLITTALEAELIGYIWESWADWAPSLKTLENGEAATIPFTYDTFTLTWHARPALFLPVVDNTRHM